MPAVQPYANDVWHSDAHQHLGYTVGDSSSIAFEAARLHQRDPLFFDIWPHLLRRSRLEGVRPSALLSSSDFSFKKGSSGSRINLRGLRVAQSCLANRAQATLKTQQSSSETHRVPVSGGPLVVIMRRHAAFDGRSHEAHIHTTPTTFRQSLVSFFQCTERSHWTIKREYQRPIVPIKTLIDFYHSSPFAARMKRRQKITLGQMRELGACVTCWSIAPTTTSHGVRISADRWPDHVRLSDSEAFLFVRLAAQAPHFDRNNAARDCPAAVDYAETCNAEI